MGESNLLVKSNTPVDEIHRKILRFQAGTNEPFEFIK